ncbi:MAG: hypothetical protein J6S85_00085 [Methanobrevibacter sp.]|nr:hypothetical protein [Methanobrevibacter sp.]
MAINSMSFEQSATILNEMLEQMTGATSLAPIDESEFIAVGTTVLQAGYDQINKALSQVLTRSIYSSRSYDPIYPSIMRDTQKWGGITRKVTVLDLDFIDDEAFNIADGNDISDCDPFLVNKQKAVQFNFYGGNVKELVVTTTEDQLRQAFSSSADFGSFVAAQAQNLVNQINQKIEAESRLTVNNMIMAACYEGGDRVVHLFTEYQADTGNSTIDITNYLSADEFEPFAKWFYGRLNTLKDLLKERTAKFHANITSYNGAALSKPIMRHTPDEFLNIFMNSNFMNQVDASALSGIYNTQFLSIGGFERVNYWQSIDDPTTVQGKPNVLDVDGTCYTTDEAQTCSNVIGVLFDEEALGITMIDEGVRSIENPRGRYFNNWYNWTARWFNDQTENFVVLVLD